MTFLLVPVCYNYRNVKVRELVILRPPISILMAIPNAYNTVLFHQFLAAYVRVYMSRPSMYCM